MKISHSIIVLASIIFVSGSMITVAMDLNRTTNNVSTNVIEAKYKHLQQKEIYLHHTEKHGEGMAGQSNKELEAKLQMDKINRQKIALKLKSLNQQNHSKSSNKLLHSRKLENRI